MGSVSPCMGPMMRDHLTRWVATFFGVGLLPACPGTWGSAAGLAVAYAAGDGLAIWTVFFCLAGLWACRGARRAFGSDDPGAFVMDEVCGMMLAVLWLPRTPAIYAGAFALFRLLDVRKPWLIGRIQASPHPWSIMGDDLLAGLFANLLLQAVVAVAGG